MEAALSAPSMPWRIAGIRAVPQAFPYQGSKRALAGQILSMFPADGFHSLIEPFAGSAAISVAASHYGLVDRIQLSDVNAPLMDLWRLIIDDPNHLIEAYAALWHGQLDDPRNFYLEVRDKFNATKQAELLLYLLCRCVKAAVRYSKNGDFNQGADHRRLGVTPARLAERLQAASRLMGCATVDVSSYAEPLTNAAVDELVYLDPPYQGTTDVPDHRYLTGLRRDNFVDVLQEAVDNRVSFIVSYDVVTDDNKYGFALPEELGLAHRHVTAGVSSQATLQGKKAVTVESLYVSPALVRRLGGVHQLDARLGLPSTNQRSLF